MQNEFADAAEIWLSLRTKRKFIFAWGGAGFVLAAIYSLTLHNVFTATSSFIVPKTSTSNSSLLNTQFLAFTGSSYVKSPGAMYVGILQSRRVIDSMIDKFNLGSVFHTKKLSQAEGRLIGETSIDPGDQDNILRIRVTDTDPKLAMTIANGYVQELTAADGELALTEAAQRRAFFERQMQEEKNALETADADLKRTQEHSGLVAPAPQTELQLQNVNNLRETIQMRESQLAGLLQGSTEQDPTVIRLRGELSSLRAELASMQSGSSTAGNLSTAQVPQAELDYIRAKREVTYHETLFEVFSKQYEGARLDEEHDAPVIQVLDVASVPDTKSGPRRSLIAISGLLLGLLGATTWVLLRNVRASFRVTA